MRPICCLLSDIFKMFVLLFKALLKNSQIVETKKYNIIIDGLKVLLTNYIKIDRCAMNIVK